MVIVTERVREERERWMMCEREEARREKRDSLGRRGEDFPPHNLSNYPYPAH